MEVAVVADIHSNLWALNAVLEKLAGVERVMCAGDITGFYTRPNEVVDALVEKKVVAVVGEHDLALLGGETEELTEEGRTAAIWNRGEAGGRALGYLKKLKNFATLRIKKHKILIAHRSPKSELGGILPETPSRDLAHAVMDADADIIVVGHTHIPLKKMILGKIILNPGSVGQPRDRDPRASYAILKVDEEVEVEFHRVEYDVEAAVEEILRAGLPEELATRLRVGW